uniref:Uncharacterized protein n=1 Tax=Seriola lalandi dorsalis TaxID=1841481 RepID=A0A3B4WHE6_SERLL
MKSHELHVVQLLEGLPAELALLGFAPLAVDRAMAHHLHHCPYHLRLLKTWLMSGQELPESLHGQLPCTECPWTVFAVGLCVGSPWHRCVGSQQHVVFQVFM